MVLQNTKDTFYEYLRSRLAALNPDHTIVLRSVTRPAVLVEENELPASGLQAAAANVAIADCFRLRWTGVSRSPEDNPGTVVLTCEIDYETAGTPANAGMDRGRALAALDAELSACVDPLPRNTLRIDYAALAHGGAATPDGSRIWWSTVEPGKTEDREGRLARKATVMVMGLENGGAR